MNQHDVYSCAIAGQAVTLTPLAAPGSHPSHLGASTIVFNTVAAAAPTDFWSIKDEYVVTIERRTKLA